MVQTAACPTVTFQPAAGVNGGPGLVPKAGGGAPLYFCQSSQPVWSAHRDPSCGHGIMEVLSDTELSLSW